MHLLSTKPCGKVLEKRKSPGQGKEEDLFEDGGAGFRPCAPPLRVLFCLEYQQGGVLGKINPALLTLSAMSLHVPTSWADITQWRMAAYTELGFLGIVLAAFRALHRAL